MSSFGIIALTPATFGLHGVNANGVSDAPITMADAAIALAASRCDATGVVNLEFASFESEEAKEALHDVLNNLVSAAAGKVGIKCAIKQIEQLDDALSILACGKAQNVVVLCLPESKSGALKKAIKRVHDHKLTAIVEAVSLKEILQAEAAGADAVIAKGHEAGSRVGEQTTFVLLQQCAGKVSIPVFAEGGVGMHTAAACFVAGAKAVVLDAQLYLTRESNLPFALKQKLAQLDGTETSLVTSEDGSHYRIYARNAQSAGDATISGATFLGQDIAFAADLARRFSTVAGIVQALRASVKEHVEAAVQLKPLNENSNLAASHNTRYPLVQGAMTRVSDTADFALKVAEGGALPFLALALMRKSEIEPLLAETQAKAKDLPWGVGILGFVPQQLRQEQLEAIHQYKPPFALIAGGRPDQAKALEDIGIKTYLHVPSPLLLESFVEMGSRRFIFEGKECGGHVGPRSSFVLWEAMVERLLQTLSPKEDAGKYHILFAGGVHDALSSAMVAALAAPLAQKGMRVGALMGTAYLFTSEAVETGAIVENFQQAALKCDETVLLETGPGHAIRCIDSPYKRTFDDKRNELFLAKKTKDEVREELELMNLGRLRIASKGLTRAASKDRDQAIADITATSGLTTVSKEKQWSDGMYMIGQIAAMHDRVLTIKELHAQVSIDGSKHLDLYKQNALNIAVQSNDAENEGVAIVGMSCLFPQANDLETYWENILNKVDAITEIPIDQWDWRNYYDENPLARDKIVSKWGGFLQDLKFDPTKYGIPPSTLPSIDPMQVLLLEVTRQALEDAGYTNREFPRERTSVVLANAGHGPITALYSLRSMLGWKLADLSPEAKKQIEDRLPEWTEDSFAGYLGNVTAGRVANRFDLGGINFSIDAACASSLAALYVSMQELRAKTSDIVFLAASDTHNQPGDYLSFSKTHAFSRQGRCRTFDATADGIVISEGMAMLVLKRLSDAERDGDRIYAVIRGIGGSSDGRDLSLTAPRPQGQMLALKRAYANAGLPPSTVSLVEAHGTGTVAGDKAEIEALKQVFEQSGAQKRACAVGSVKTMIGHTKAAAGLASLIKVAKALHHKVLPPTMGVKVPNPACDFENSPFYINSEARPWIARTLESEASTPRRAGVSAFGFGGTNFHAVLEEYVPAAKPNEQSASLRWPTELFLIKAKSRADLLKATDALKETARRLHQNESTSAGALRMAAQQWHLKQHDKHERAERELCLAIVASSIDDLNEKLQRAKSDLLDTTKCEIKDPRGVYFVDFDDERLSKIASGKVAFMFPGQGSQQVDMLKDLCLQFSEVRSTFERASRHLDGRFDRPLNEFIFPQPAFTDEDRAAQQARLTDTHKAQPAVGAADLAMFNLLQEFGLTPHMVGGHSYGEYVALYAAGAMSEEDLLGISELRGRILAQHKNGNGKGTMAALACAVDEAKSVLAACEGVTLANINSPNQCVVSGEVSQVEKVVSVCKERGLQARLIPVSQAFHSSHMVHAQKPLKEGLSKLGLSDLTIPVYSNADAIAYPPHGKKIVDKLTDHIVSPVDFVAQVRKMHEDGATIFVEVGPGAVLTGLVESTLASTPGSAYVTYATDRAQRHGLTQLQHTLAALASYGLNVDLTRLFKSRVGELEHLTPPGASDAPGKPRLLYLVNGLRIKRVDGNESSKAATKPAQPAASVQTGNSATQVKNPTNHMALKSETPASTQPQAPAARPAQAQPVSPAAQKPAREPGNGRQVTSSPAAPVNPPVVPQQPNPLQPNPLQRQGANRATGDRSVDQVMLQFQETMLQMTNSFLETQKQVMLTYLSAKAGNAVAPAMPQNFALPAVPQQPMLPEYAPQPLAQVDFHLQPAAASAAQQAASTQLLNTLSQQVESVGQPQAAAEPSVQAQPEETPASSPAVDSEALVQALLEIVSQRTGYPPEMLDPTLDLEADLGIDSIKRVEILNSFRRILPDWKQQQLESGIEELAGTKTLQGIMDWIRTEPATQAPSSKGNGHDSAAPKESNGHVQPAGKNGNGHEGNGQYKSGNGHDVQYKSGNGNGHEPDYKSGNGHEVETNGHQVQQPKNGSLIRRGLVKTVALDALAQVDAPTTEGVFVITEDDQGVAKAVVKLLQAAKLNTVLLKHSPENGKPGTHAADFHSEDSLNEALAAIKKEHGTIAALIHLFGLGGHASQPLAPVNSLFTLAKALESELTDPQRIATTALLTAHRLGGGFGCNGVAPESFFEAGAVGVVKSIFKEHPELFCKAIDFDTESSAKQAAQAIVQELFARESRVEVAYRGGERFALDVVASPMPDEKAAPLPIDSQSVVLVTGGARGITAEIALEIAQAAKPTLIIVGRTAEPSKQEDAATEGLTSPRDLKAKIMEQLKAAGKPVSIAAVESIYQNLLKDREIRDNLAAMVQAGARVEYHALDVRDEARFGQLIDSIYKQHGRVDGVVHGAGVIEDAYLKDKTLDSFKRVVQTKVDSAVTLSKHLNLDTLKFFYLFSSVVGRTGNAGQTDYVAANEIVNKLATALDARAKGRVASLMWGPWNGGMAQPELESIFARYGWAMIDPQAGRDSFINELKHGEKGNVEVLLVAELSGSQNLPAPKGARLHDATVYPSKPGALEFSLTLDPRQDLYLNDHTFDGVPVMPMAMSLEIMLEAVASAYPEWHIARVHRLDIPAGIVFDSPAKKASVVTEELSRSERDMRVAVSLSTGHPSKRVNFKAQVELVKNIDEMMAPNAAALPEGVLAKINSVSDLDNVPDAMEQPPHISNVYGQWLFHGPIFQGIKSIISLGESGVLGELVGSSAARCLTNTNGEEWTMDPTLFDSAMQLAGVWARQFLDITVLPTGFRKLHRFAKPTAGKMLGRVFINPGANIRELTCDVAVYNEGGELAFVIEGLGGVGSKSLNRLANQGALGKK